MQLIAKQTVGAGGASSVTFSNIPQTYTDLKLVISGRSSASAGYAAHKLTFNGTAFNTNWSAKGLYGNGASAASENWTSSDFVWSDAATATASTFASNEIYIPNYTSSNNKSLSADMVTENNGTTAIAYMLAGLWSNTAAISSITLTTASGTYSEFSTFYLYGISNSSTQNTSVPLASGGDVITTDGSYWYHAFKYSGSFTPLKNLTADVLVVAGGGGGGGGNGGAGAGAGGLLGFISQALTAQSYTCTVGAAGAAGGNNASGSVGGNSIFGSLTTVIGGGKGDGGGFGSGVGGSGGGGYPGNAGSAGTAGQGNAGGNGIAGFASPYPAGGGGGAGAAGQTAIGSQSGAGGVGSSAYSSWGLATTTGQNVSGTVYYAGGGGGASTTQGAAAGAGGLGGGGAGNANSGLPNTGGGGAGGGNGTAAGNGGSGIIIVRYPV
jgi:hypothetical protein